MAGAVSAPSPRPASCRCIVACGSRREVEVDPGVDHGFAFPRRATYHQAAEFHWRASWTCSIERWRLTETTGASSSRCLPSAMAVSMKARTLADGSAVRNATASSTFSAKSASGRNTTSGKPNPRMDSVAGGGHGERRHEIDALLTVT